MTIKTGKSTAVAVKKPTAITTVASEETLAELRQNFPQEMGFQRTLLPRLGMVSQDQTEGKGKTLKVVTEAGTFFIEKQNEEEVEAVDGSKSKQNVWRKEEIGMEIEGIILYQRKQLKFYDEKTETFTSSAVYDNEDEVIPLFTNKAEIDRGTPAELKAREEYQYEKDGKQKSKLEDNRLLYVLFLGRENAGQIFQMNLRGSSMYAWMTFARKFLPPSVLTVMNSEPKEKGSIAWNQMTFNVVRSLNEKEATLVKEKQAEIIDGVKQEKAFYASISAKKDEAKQELDKF